MSAAAVGGGVQLVLSDLHLGMRGGLDVLARRQGRQSLIDALEGVERVILLGDVLELRQGPAYEALVAAKPFFEQLGQALDGRELVIVAGNHDHGLLTPWFAARALQAAPSPLGLESIIEPADASPLALAIANAARGAHVRFAYPGIWLREDVYAMHGHFLDCHSTVPAFERLALGAMMRMLHRPQAQLQSSDDYEAVAAPLFDWLQGVGQYSAPNLNDGSSLRLWRAMSRPRSPRAWALARAFPLVVAALNRARLGPVLPDLSAAGISDSWLKAMGEVARRLGLGDAHVIFGHTHRAGPMATDDQSMWIGPGGARLINCGCWAAAPTHPGDPYSPGWVVVVEGEGAPRLRSLS